MAIAYRFVAEIKIAIAKIAKIAKITEMTKRDFSSTGKNHP
jgi:hypothetical protein